MEAWGAPWQLLLTVVKASAIIFLVFWVRVTFPRLRIDQLMNFSWKVLLPISVLNLLATAAGVLYFGA